MLSAAVDRYLGARRAVGYRLRDTEDILRDFVAFASGKAETGICSRTVLQWIGSRKSSPLGNYVRLQTVARLARYLHAEDERHEIPQGAFHRHGPRRRPPFLFTPTDVEALVGAARRLGPEQSLQPHIYSTLFGLLASTGLRVSEALNLRIEDVTSNGLLIRNTKFGKSLLLPLHATTKAHVDEYLVRRLREAGSCPFVFVSIRGSKLHRTTVGGVFHRLIYSLGIARPEDKLRPRLHDLRFYFANQALTRSPGDQRGIGRHMVALTTYLGHSDVRNGYWYLEATPALFAKIAARCEDFANATGERNVLSGNHCATYSGPGPVPCPNFPAGDVTTTLTPPANPPSAIAITFAASTVNAGSSFTATFAGNNLSASVLFDVRFRAPGSTTDAVALNWQQGTSAAHSVAAGTQTGIWTVTGVRAHSSTMTRLGLSIRFPLR